MNPHTLFIIDVAVFAVQYVMSLLERVKGIEPSSKAWEAFVLPLNYTRD